MRGFLEMPDTKRRYGKNVSKKRSCLSKIPRITSYLTGLNSKRETLNEQSIVVDLTKDDVKLTSAGSSEVCAMIADSSSKFNRDNKKKNGIARALRDRGPCVIPVQPNHCLPIHPAPPIPTSRKSQSSSPALKLAIETSLSNAIDVESPIKSRIFEINADSEEEQGVAFIYERNREKKISSKESNSCPVKILDPVKRKIIDDNKSKDRGKDSTKDSKKKKKSSDIVNLNDGLNESYKNSITSKNDKEGNAETLSGTKCAASIVGSTTEIHFGKDKIVPPLRLKKVIRQEGKNGDRGKAEIASSKDKEANYRIITGTTPRPDSQSIPTTCEYWSRDYHFDNDNNFDVPSTSSISRNILRRSSLKSDDYKLKYRRNRLRRKLKELQDKALDLSREIAKKPTNIVDSNPQRNTRLRQMMNCYEKQMENVSKLLNKLYNVNPLANELIDLEENKKEHRWNDVFIGSFSPISSPEPPKLSPRSTIDYPNKSPDSIRNSPPVLPKVSINISSNLDIQDEHDAETVQLPDESTWIACDNNTTEISSMGDNFCEDTINQEWESNNNNDNNTNNNNNNNIIDLRHRSTTPPIPSSTSIDPCSSKNIENGQAFVDNIGEIVEKDNIKMVNEKKETIKVGSSNHSIAKEKTEIKKQETRDSDSAIKINLIEGPIISSVSGGSEFPPHIIRCDQVNAAQPMLLPITKTKTKTSTSTDMMNILQLESNYYDSTLVKKNNLETNQIEGSKKGQKVTSSTTQSRKTDNGTVAPIFNQVEYPFTDQHCPTQSSNDNRIMTEQFPTLGNWVAKMSKKQVSKQKTKLQTAVNNIGIIPTDESTRSSGLEGHKVLPNDANTTNCNNALNLTTPPQWNTERWHRQQHHQQRQQQQLFQHVAAGATPQSLPSTTTLNSGICTPHSTTHFYPSNYNIDPYSGATFSYHSALYPVYGGYPYHSRLHPGTPLTSYHHIPMQNPLNSPLRPLSHVDKHLTSLQDANRNFTSDILKYSGSLPGAAAAAEFQPSNDFGFDRLRATTSTDNHNAAASCLSPLLLASSALSSGTQQTLPRMPLNGYPAGNNQYGRNRIIPDVVAAAAAAAVVAAASIGRQRTPLTPYSKSGSTAMNTAVMEVDSTRLTSNTSNNRTREHLLSHQGQPSLDVGTKEPQWNSAEYRPLPNLLLDRLPFVRTEHDFPTTSMLSSNIQNPPVSIPTVPLPQMSKKISRNVERDCETPHLGKVNRSPDTLSNLKCSNCGIAGSIFKCLGCEVAFYCNERCQARHWNVHVEKCPKKMPKLKKVT